ncbi:MAG TPA: tripartite tricarboxylate transporter TctB family protein [Burkholderiales bacterium]|nr:tripartite tricarboxylate transporter TctB family protein [Burkholderiales bacterium]
MRAARLGEALFGALLLGLGLFAIYQASTLPVGSLRQPDAGLFPLAVSVVLTLPAALSLGARNHAQDSDTAERAGIVRVVVLIAALAAYAWLLPRVGFIVCTIALLVLMLRGLGRVGWLWTSVAAVTGTVACYVLFTRLGLPLPDGLLGF